MSCAEKTVEQEKTDPNIMTQQSEHLTIINSNNGSLSYIFEAPLLERYDMAKEPYMEFRKGIKMTTFEDSTRIVKSTLVANYAIFYEDREIWEAKGDVVVLNIEGDKLETQQLFWNQKRKEIYSNVDSKVTQGEDVMYGTAFEADETFTDFIFRKPKGRVEVDMEPMAVDSLSADSIAVEAVVTPPVNEPKKTNTRATRAVPPKNMPMPPDRTINKGEDIQIREDVKAQPLKR